MGSVLVKKAWLHWTVTILMHISDSGQHSAGGEKSLVA